MTHDRRAVFMGVLMGGLMPFMLHGMGAQVGLGFLLAHGLAFATLFGLASLVPRLRRVLHRHGRMAGRMAAVAAGGAVLVCTHCLWTGHAIPQWVG